MHFRAKWIPVRVKKMRQSKEDAFSSEVDTGSREENPKKQETGAVRPDIALSA
jgi:hypothetical protein